MLSQIGFNLAGWKGALSPMPDQNQTGLTPPLLIVSSNNRSREVSNSIPPVTLWRRRIGSIGMLAAVGFGLLGLPLSVVNRDVKAATACLFGAGLSILVGGLSFMPDTVDLLKNSRHPVER
ncbi:MAG: hypothetical protein HYT77_09225 [Deltaproteobacteria bacterium]|nr:hypothetical protein [Deltaproteobacteria bacterium]